MFVNSYGPHAFLLVIAGLVWLVAIAVVVATLFFVIRYAVLSALKAHTRWLDAGKPSSSGWSAKPAPHPGPAAAGEPPASAPPTPEPKA